MDTGYQIMTGKEIEKAKRFCKLIVYDTFDESQTYLVDIKEIETSSYYSYTLEILKKPKTGYVDLPGGSSIPEELWLLLENTGLREEYKNLRPKDLLLAVKNHIQKLIFPQ